MSKALIMIDIQNDYFKGGACELSNPIKASLKAKKILEYFRKKSWPIIHIQHINIQDNATFFLPNTPGVEIHESVKPLNNEIIIEKNFPNGFLQTHLENTLDKLHIKEVFICGMMSHMCVDATTRAAFDLGFECSVIYDACATKDLLFQGNSIMAHEVHNAFMAALGTVYAKMLNVEQMIS